MEYKKIFSNGRVCDVKLFKKSDVDSSTEESVRKFFKEQDDLGFSFLKAFRDGEETNTLFIKE